MSESEILQKIKLRHPELLEVFYHNQHETQEILFSRLSAQLITSILQEHFSDVIPQTNKSYTHEADSAFMLVVGSLKPHTANILFEFTETPNPHGKQLVYLLWQPDSESITEGLNGVAPLLHLRLNQLYTDVFIPPTESETKLLNNFDEILEWAEKKSLNEFGFDSWDAFLKEPPVKSITLPKVGFVEPSMTKPEFLHAYNSLPKDFYPQGPLLANGKHVPSRLVKPRDKYLLSLGGNILTVHSSCKTDRELVFNFYTEVLSHLRTRSSIGRETGAWAMTTPAELSSESTFLVRCCQQIVYAFCRQTKLPRGESDCFTKLEGTPTGVLCHFSKAKTPSALLRKIGWHQKLNDKIRLKETQRKGFLHRTIEYCTMEASETYASSLIHLLLKDQNRPVTLPPDSLWRTISTSSCHPKVKDAQADVTKLWTVNAGVSPTLYYNIIQEAMLAQRLLKSEAHKHKIWVVPIHLDILPNGDRTVGGIAILFPRYSKSGQEGCSMMILESWSSMPSYHSFNDDDEIFEVGHSKYLSFRRREYTYNKASDYCHVSNVIVPAKGYCQFCEDETKFLPACLLLYLTSRNHSILLEGAFAEFRRSIMGIGAEFYSFKKLWEEVIAIRNNPTANYLKTLMVKAHVTGEFLGLQLGDELMAILHPYLGGSPHCSQKADQLYSQIVETLDAVDGDEPFTQWDDQDQSMFLRPKNRTGYGPLIFNTMKRISDMSPTRARELSEVFSVTEKERSISVLASGGTKFVPARGTSVPASTAFWDYQDQMRPIFEHYNIKYTDNSWWHIVICANIFGEYFEILPPTWDRSTLTKLFVEIFSAGLAVKQTEHNRSEGRNIVTMSISLQNFQNFVEEVAKIVNRMTGSHGTDLSSLEKRDLLRKVGLAASIELDTFLASLDKTKWNQLLQISTAMLLLAASYPNDASERRFVLLVGQIWREKCLYFPSKHSYYTGGMKTPKTIDELSRMNDEQLLNDNIRDDLMMVLRHYRKKRVIPQYIKCDLIMLMGMFNHSSTTLHIWPAYANHLDDNQTVSKIIDFCASSDDSMVRAKKILGMSALESYRTISSLWKSMGLNDSEDKSIIHDRLVKVEYNSNVFSMGQLIPNLSRDVAGTKVLYENPEKDLETMKNQLFVYINEGTLSTQDAAIILSDKYLTSLDIHDMLPFQKRHPIFLNNLTSAGLIPQCIPIWCGGTNHIPPELWGTMDDKMYWYHHHKDTGKTNLYLEFLASISTPPDVLASEMPVDFKLGLHTTICNYGHRASRPKRKQDQIESETTRLWAASAEIMNSIKFPPLL
ncbi:RNA-dependent RNA polymerase [Changping earthworm virus 2]|uniref:RNA-dependent RNA polymerase n=1 Tax=Changping earthworm virus 2 TaxID=1922827 RepID=UPI00090B39E8|nr:RNA-dependent RNA polymerase [Changping earthworm virus 2]APG77870.1 RNA-dependent RNA polymerase [Changping earthworm virus 2]